MPEGWRVPGHRRRADRTTIPDESPRPLTATANEPGMQRDCRPLTGCRMR